jgi:hypothetical protein
MCSASALDGRNTFTAWRREGVADFPARGRSPYRLRHPTPDLQEFFPCFLPSLITEITTNLASLHLESNIAAQILATVLAPLMRLDGSSSEVTDLAPRRAQRRRTGRPQSRRAPRRRRRRYKPRAPTEARDRALAALRSNPDATPTEIAKLAKVSRSTAANARKRFAREARLKAKTASRGKTDPKTERRSRAQRFLKDALAQGPKQAEATPELERRPFDQDLWARPPPEPYDERYLRLRNHGLAMLHSYVAEMEAEEATAKVNQQAVTRCHCASSAAESSISLPLACAFAISKSSRN